jgi:hypothetical protein
MAKLRANKNELVTFVGVKDGEVAWADVASWMDDTTIHSLIRQDVSAIDGFTCGKVIEVLKKYVPAYWKRKSFEDFSYITVNVPKLTYLWVFLASGVIVVIVGLFAEAKGEELFRGGFFGSRTRVFNRGGSFSSIRFRRNRWR